MSKITNDGLTRLHICTHMATVGVKGLTYTATTFSTVTCLAEKGSVMDSICIANSPYSTHPQGHFVLNAISDVRCVL